MSTSSKSAIHAHQLDAAELEWLLTERLVVHVAAACSKGAAAAESFERAHAILRPWLVSLALEPPQPARPDWAKVHRRLGVSDRQALLCYGAAIAVKHAFSDQALPQALEQAFESHNQYMTDWPQAHQRVTLQRDSHPASAASEEGVRLSCRAFSTKVTPRLNHLAQMAGLEAATLTAMRYATVLGLGPLWTRPPLVNDHMAERRLVEAFSSPFAANSLVSRSSGDARATFCSLFADTRDVMWGTADAAFGSLGDFFKVSVEEYCAYRWLVDVPHDPDVAHQAAMLVADRVSPQRFAPAADVLETVFVCPASCGAAVFMHELAIIADSGSSFLTTMRYSDAAGQAEPVDVPVRVAILYRSRELPTPPEKIAEIRDGWRQAFGV